MYETQRRLSAKQLNQIFLSALGQTVVWHSAIERKPLEIDIAKPLPLSLRVYIYNCTNPAGGRPADEYKIQLIVPNQPRGERGTFDNSGGRIVLLVAYVRLFEALDDGIFVLYNALMHDNFSYSANLQVKSDVINGALVNSPYCGHKTNGESVIAVRYTNLVEGIEKRLIIE